VPLDFAPGERAEFDFGEATIKLKGQLVKCLSWPDGSAFAGR